MFPHGLFKASTRFMTKMVSHTLEKWLLVVELQSRRLVFGKSSNCLGTSRKLLWIVRFRQYFDAVGPNQEWKLKLWWSTSLAMLAANIKSKTGKFWNSYWSLQLNRHQNKDHETILLWQGKKGKLTFKITVNSWAVQKYRMPTQMSKRTSQRELQTEHLSTTLGTELEIAKNYTLWMPCEIYTCILLQSWCTFLRLSI